MDNMYWIVYLLVAEFFKNKLDQVFLKSLFTLRIYRKMVKCRLELSWLE